MAEKSLHSIPDGSCRWLRNAQKGIGQELPWDGAEAGGDVAPGQGSWWPWCRGARITQGRGARGDQKCCQRVLWEQKYQLVPNWGRFLAKLLF